MVAGSSDPNVSLRSTKSVPSRTVALLREMRLISLWES